MDRPLPPDRPLCIENLRHINLAFEIDDALQRRIGQRPLPLFVLKRGVSRLRSEARLARIGHEIHADRLSSLRIDIGQPTQLQRELRVGIRNVLQVRRHARTPEYGHRGSGAVKPVSSAGIATGGIAHHFNRKLRLSLLRAARESPGGSARDSAAANESFPSPGEDPDSWSRPPPQTAGPCLGLRSIARESRQPKSSWHRLADGM